MYFFNFLVLCGSRSLSSRTSVSAPSEDMLFSPPTLIADSLDLSEGDSGNVVDGDGVRAPRLDTVEAPEVDC